LAVLLPSEIAQWWIEVIVIPSDFKAFSTLRIIIKLVPDPFAQDTNTLIFFSS
jgi:hypothetical protein